jgi:hypothetical protein
VSLLETLAKNPATQSAYNAVLSAGFVPRRAFAHYFMNTGGIRSRVHLQNYYSTFFPHALTEATARVWLCDATGRVIAHKQFAIPPFGQLYLEIEDIVGHPLDSEGMIFIDVVPPKSLRKELKTIPALRQLTVQTPFWVSFRDDSDNYMYVHSIESYRGKVFGAMWPVGPLMAHVQPERAAWESWRLLDVELLDELQVVVMNHSHLPGSTSVQVIDGETDEVKWSQQVELTTRASRRVVVPPEKIAEWKASARPGTVRVGLDPVLTGNGKPYVIMRYGGGPWSLHHG